MDLGNKKTEKNGKKYDCELCNFITSDKTDFTRHCATRKHKMETNGNNKNNNEGSIYICRCCNKQYLTRTGLWKHNQKCKIDAVKKSTDDDNMIDNQNIKNYIMQLGEDFKSEIKSLLQEQSNQFVINNTNNIQNNKITNTQFNLNVFLQQTCKDAINMSDFIDSLEINTKSLERTGTHGYVHGISTIFMDGLRKLKVHERPIHCTDLKREVLYIKDNDKWTKDEDNKQFKKALATVVHRNMIQIVKWEEENPETSNPESKNYEFYFVLASQSLGGGDLDVTARNNDKILKAIAKEVHIDKKVKKLL